MTSEDWMYVFGNLGFHIILCIGCVRLMFEILFAMDKETDWRWETSEERESRRDADQEARDYYRFRYGHLDMSKRTVNYQIHKDEFAARLFRKEGGEYDAAFYYIGQFDYDPYDKEMVDVVVDLILLKAFTKNNHPYNPELTQEELEAKLFRYRKGANHHEKVRCLVEDREKQEELSRQNGMIYVPDGDEFAFRVALLAVTSSEQEIAQEIKRIMAPPKKWFIVEMWEETVDQWNGFSWWERIGCAVVLYLSFLLG